MGSLRRGRIRLTCATNLSLPAVRARPRSQPSRPPLRSSLLPSWRARATHAGGSAFRMRKAPRRIVRVLPFRPMRKLILPDRATAARPTGSPAKARPKKETPPTPICRRPTAGRGRRPRPLPLLRTRRRKGARRAPPRRMRSSARAAARRPRRLRPLRPSPSRNPPPHLPPSRFRCTSTAPGRFEQLRPLDRRACGVRLRQGQRVAVLRQRGRAQLRMRLLPPARRRKHHVGVHLRFGKRRMRARSA